jgi:hypothetical protein
MLKIYMEQNDLDKPVSGGLGSYKLYVLVAYHIERHLMAGGQDRPGEILLSFLFRFGNVRGFGTDDRCRTRLRQDEAVRFDSETEADLSNVHKLHQCAQLFQRGWDCLWSRLHANGRGERSMLAELLNVSKLQNSRQFHLKKATNSASQHDIIVPQTSDVALPGADTAQKDERDKRSSSGNDRPHKRARR